MLVKVKERDHIYMGQIVGTTKPMLLYRWGLKHLHVLGGAGSGKTHRVLVGTVRQLISRRDSRIIVIDMKKDEALVRTLKRLAQAAGLPFRLFTTDPRERSCLYNPFAQSHWGRLTTPEKAEIVLAALGMDYGEGFGESFFSAANKIIINRAVEKLEIGSYSDLRRHLFETSTRKKLKIPLRTWESGSHVLTAIDGLAQVLPLNLGRGEVPDSVADAAIDLAQDSSTPGVAVFSMPATIQPITGRMVARDVLHNLVAERGIHQGPMVPVFVAIDEANQMMTPNVSTLFAQARDRGVSLGLFHQSMSQLKTKDHDYIAEIITNCRTKIYHGPFADKEIADVMRVLGGERREILDSYDSMGQLSQREQLVPRIGIEQLKEAGRVQGRALIDMQPGEGLSRFKHPIATDVPFTMSAEDFQEISADPWPGEPDETIVAAEYDPNATPPAPKDKPKSLGPLFGN